MGHGRNGRLEKVAIAEIGVPIPAGVLTVASQNHGACQMVTLHHQRGSGGKSEKSRRNRSGLEKKARKSCFKLQIRGKAGFVAWLRRGKLYLVIQDKLQFRLRYYHGNSFFL